MFEYVLRKTVSARWSRCAMLNFKINEIPDSHQDQ